MFVLIIIINIAVSSIYHRCRYSNRKEIQL